MTQPTKVHLNKKQDHLVITNGPGTGEKIGLSDIPLILGRVRPADVVINTESVSRKHARISRSGSAYVIEDLGSRNGTSVNGERINTPRTVSNGDVIQLGPDVELLIVLSSEQDAYETIVQKPSILNKTVMMEEVAPVVPDTPPQLVINESGQDPKIYVMTAPRIRIGRQEDNDIVLANRFVSRYHAELEKRGQDYFLIPSPNLSNTLILDGQPVMEPTRLQHGAKIRIGGYAPAEMVTLDYLSRLGEAEPVSEHIVQFNENRLMRIGRHPDNDIVLHAPTVSLYHAEVEKIGQRYRLHDLRSSNGTFVNGKGISGAAWVHPGDTIQIGPYRFAVDEHEFAQSDQSAGGVRVEVLGLQKWVNKKLNILQDISLLFQPREFIVIVGQSGGGKTTLMDAIAGYRPATQGRVIVNGSIDVYKEYDAIRATIGYVPQKDIIHMELTVIQALDYAARLRMPADTSQEERSKRIEEVMKDLDLTHRRNTQISELSGGQQKRVSIGVELLTKPGLFFLDEPTSGLDPGMETELMHLMRRLADQGRTIIMITHATKNVMLADKVVFLARGGSLAWFGPPEEALAYFDQYRSERDRRSSPMEFDHIYTLLDRQDLGSGADWTKRYKSDPAYQKYIGEPLAGKVPTPHMEISKAGSAQISKRTQTSALRQFLILSERNLKIMTRDKFSLALLLLTAPLMASLDFVLASGVGRGTTTFSSGTFNNVIITLVVLTNTSILVGGLAFMRELVKERAIYKRERMVNLSLSSYIMSKVWIAVLLAVYQAFCFTAIRYLAFDMPGGIEELLFFYITEFLLVVSGTMLGLFASALAPNANAAPLVMIMFVIPELVLSGSLVPLPSPIKAPASSSWAFQAFMAVSGAGSDPAADPCWKLTKAQRDNLTLDQKNLECPCMGENALRQKSCNFPGLGEYYTSAIDQTDPIKPSEPGAQPTQPANPPGPTKPSDPNNLQLLQVYVRNLDDYNQKVSQLQDQYKNQMGTWQQQEADYKTQFTTYQKDLSSIQLKRAIAVGSAEATISRYKKDYDWAYINKKDRSGYIQTLVIDWAAMLVIILVLLGAVFVLQKRIDSD